MSEIRHPFIESIKNIEKRLDELTQKLKINQIQDPNYIYLDNAELLQLLKISKETAANWRKDGLIAFSQPTSKQIYYRLADVQAFLNKHYRPFKKK